MATDMNRLQGEIAENPETHALLKGDDGDDVAVQKLLIGFLRSLLDEQRPEQTRQIPLHQESV